MSKTVDERVVEMRFDNKQFESNVQTSMSTLDKLKQKLNLSGASKGLENINASAKNVNMSGLASGVETVRAKFSALEVIGVTALANITNSAVNAGKHMIKALTLDPVISGFQEYETQINAIQTILANTSSKGTTLDQVNDALDELNHYADLTIYNFTEMTRNIGTFTAAGVDLETSVSAIQGIANLAAVSGSTSQQASTAMYQLSQALASGTVKLMDWNSVVNAGMGGEVFQNALRETSELLGTGAEAAIKAEGSFRESLSTGWLTSEVLTETLKKFTTSGANEYVAKYTGLSEKAVKAALEEAEARYGEADAIDQASKALAKKSGKNADEIKDALQMAKTAEDAATKVKTFSQLMDTLKEAIQSGWTQTWEILIGDFEEAKDLFSSISDFLGGVIQKASDARNNLLESALGKGFTGLAEKVQGFIKPVKEAANVVTKVKDSVQDLDEIVNNVIRGDFGNGQERINKLTEAGQNYYKVQNKVNEALGNSFRYSDKQVEAQEKLLGSHKKATKAKSDESKETTKLTDEEKNRIKILANMSEEQLKSKGYTDEQIAAFRELGDTAKKLGIPLNEFIDNLDEINGRWLLIDSFKNIGKSLVKVFSAIGQAWREVFDPIKPEQIFNIIGAFHKFTSTLVMSDETADKLKRTFKGLFAIIDIITTVTGGALKNAIKIVSTLLGMADVDILSVTAAIGDAIVKVRDWIDAHNIFAKSIEIILPYLKQAVTGIKEWIDTLKDSDNIPRDIALGLVNGLRAGIKGVVSVMIELGKAIIDTIKSVLGIHSPSTEFMEIGKNIILGLIEGLQNGVSALWDVLKKIGSKCIEIVKKIDFGKVFAAAVTVGMLYTLKKFADILEMFAAPLEGFGDLLSGIGKAFTGLGKSLAASAWEKRSKAILNIAIAIAILAGSIALLTKLDTKKMWGAIGALAVLGAIITALAFAASKMGETTSIFKKSTTPIVGVAASILILAIAMNKLAKIDSKDIPKILGLLTAIVVGLSILMVAIGKMTKGGEAKNMDKVGKMLVKMSLALLIMVGVMKLISMMNPGDIAKGLIVIGMMSLIFAGLIAVSKLGGEHAKKAGSMLLKISGAFLIMTAVIKIISSMNPQEIAKGLVVITIFGLVFTALIAVSKLAGQNAGKAGAMLLMISGAFLIMAAVIKVISSLSMGDIAKGLLVVTAIGVLFAALIAMSEIAGKNASKAGSMLLKMSIALLTLTGALFLLSKMDSSGLGKALGIVTLLEVLFGGLIAVTKLAQNCEKTLITITVAITLLIAAVIGLTFVDPGKLKTATKAVSAIVATFATLVAATSLLKNSSGLTKALLPILGAIVVLSGILIIMSELDVQASIASAVALGILINSLASACLILSNVGDGASKAIPVALAMSGVIGILALILGIMSALDVQASISSAVALGILLNAMAAALFILNSIGSVSMASIGAMAVLGLVVGELALILGLLAHFDVEPSIETAVALSTLLLAMSAALFILNSIGSVSMASIGAMAVLGLVVGELALILGLLAHFDVEPSIETAVALSTLLLAMSAALVVLGVVGMMGAAAFVGIGALATLIAAIGGIVVALGALSEKFPQLEEFLNSGIPILEKIGYALGSFVGNIVAGLADGIAQSLPPLGQALSDFMTNAQGFIDGAKNVDSSVSEGVSALTKAVLLLTAANLVESIASFLTLGSSFGDLGTELSNFMTNCSGFLEGSKNIDPSAMEGIKTLADALLVLTSANLLDQLTSFISGESSLANFGSQLSDFGAGLKGFGDSVNGTNTEAIQNAANAAKALVDVANALPGEGGWIQKICGEQSIASFGDKLPKFGEGLKKFAASVEGINTESIRGAADAAQALVDVANNLPGEGGWLQKICGEQSIASFGDKLPKFGKGLKSFATSVDGINTEAIKSASSAAKALVSLANDIPNEGGWISKIVGENTIDTFGSKLPAFGKGLKSFAASVDGINAEAITASVKAAKGLVDIANEIPNEGGWISKIVGDNGIGNFGDELASFGTSLHSYSSTITTGTGINADKVSESVKVAKSLVKMAEWLDDHDYDEIKDFPDALITLGTSLNAYSSEVKEVNQYTIEGSVNSIKKVANMIKYLNGIDYSNVNVLPDNLTDLGKKLKAFSMSVAGIDANQAISSVTALRQILHALADMKNTDFSVIDTFNSSLKKISKSSVDNFINAFKGANVKAVNAAKGMIDNLVRGFTLNSGKVKTASSKAVQNAIKGIESKQSAFATAGTKLMSNLAKGISQKTGSVTTAVRTAVSSACSAISSQYTVFYNQGTYLGAGLVLGIQSKEQAAYDAGYALGQKAAQGEKDGQKSNSPSKLTIQYGKWLGEGLVIGIEKMNKSVYNAGYGMGETATNTISKAVSRISDMMDTSIDSQPTIRPVVDLSNVQSSADTINGMFGINPSIGLLSNVGAIDSMMNASLQNGANDDVVSAINKLNKNLENVGGNSYVIDGITYDDGSNITDAVQSLVRAARVERRV